MTPILMETMRNQGAHPDMIEFYDAVISRSRSIGGIERVKRALQKEGVDINGYPYPNSPLCGFRALEYAAFGDDVPMVKCLLDNNADVNLKVKRTWYEQLTRKPEIRDLLPIDKQTFVD